MSVMSYNRQQLVINDFKGVDLSSSPLQIHCSRASFASNLINDNGVNHKRPGWRQELNFAGKQINGIYEYKNDGHEVRIVYAGKTFYEVKDGTAALIDFQEDENFRLQDQKVQFFRQRGRVYIIGCGDYLVYGTWDEGETYEIRRVYNDEDTYVPTTTVNREACIYDAYGANYYNPGYIKDDINLLTSKRKNTFIGIDASYESQALFRTDVPYSKLLSVKVEYLSGGSILTKEVKNQVYELDTVDGKAGFLLHEDSSPPGDVPYANVTVTFEVSNIYTDIPKCSIGTTFGAYGRSDRLFLSGNSEMKNVDFYSGFEDFTYFSANSRTEMGSDDAEITGYLRLSDSTLATFKEGFGNEPTVYYRKATEVDDNGADAIAFTRFEGSVGEACINPYCVANLAGDELMLSENGLYGIVIPENLNNNDRYFRERSRHINADLRRRELKNATAIVYKNRYYLAVDGVCYIADPRFKNYLSNDIDGSFNYEWWYWENIPARVFAIIGGELYFGTADGKICVFDDKFTDRTYDETVEGELTADGASFTYRGEIDCDICSGDEITLSGLKEKLYITEHDSKNCTFKVSLTKGGEPIGNIVGELYKGEAPSSLAMKVYCYKNVVSSWYTPVFDLGAIDVAKTLLSMSLTVDPNIRGKVSFGYETKNVLRLLDFRSERVFDFDNIDFDDFSFDTGFTSSYTVKVKARRFNYIMFKFISDTASDCAVCNFKATYIYNGRHRGTN